MVLSFSAKPFDVEGLHVEETALVLIDLQKDFMLPGGFGESLGNDVLQLARCVEPCKRMLAEARKAGMMVIHTREGHRPDLSDCPALKLAKSKPGLRIGDVGPMGRILVRGEDGHDLIDECKPIPGEPIVDKPGKGAFHATDLAQILAVRGIKNILVGGVTSEVCVQTTIREGNDRGYNCILLSDCAASFFPEFHKITCDMIAAQGGIFGFVADSSDVITSLGSQPKKAKR